MRECREIVAPDGSKATILDRGHSKQREHSRKRSAGAAAGAAAWGPCGAFCVALFNTTMRTLIAQAIRELPQQSTLIADVKL